MEHHQHSLGFLDYAAGNLRRWLGSRYNVKCDSYDAECIALAFAQAWCLNLLAHLPVVFHYDSTSAGGNAAGKMMPRDLADAMSASAFSRYTAQAESLEMKWLTPSHVLL